MNIINLYSIFFILIRSNSPDFRQRMPRSAFKPSQRARDQLVDDTADILSTMFKTRRAVYQTNYLSQQVETIPSKKIN